MNPGYLIAGEEGSASRKEEICEQGRGGVGRGVLGLRAQVQECWPRAKETLSASGPDHFSKCLWLGHKGLAEGEPADWASVPTAETA